MTCVYFIQIVQHCSQVHVRINIIISGLVKFKRTFRIQFLKTQQFNLNESDIREKWVHTRIFSYSGCKENSLPTNSLIDTVYFDPHIFKYKYRKNLVVWMLSAHATVYWNLAVLRQYNLFQSKINYRVRCSSLDVWSIRIFEHEKQHGQCWSSN